jgi:hypothetical protein
VKVKVKRKTVPKCHPIEEAVPKPTGFCMLEIGLTQLL